MAVTVPQVERGTSDASISCFIDPRPFRTRDQTRSTEFTASAARNAASKRIN